jgi:hypothetical protein
MEISLFFEITVLSDYSARPRFMALGTAQAECDLAQKRQKPFG